MTQTYISDTISSPHLPIFHVAFVQLITTTFVQTVLSSYFKLIPVNFSNLLNFSVCPPCTCSPFQMLSVLCIENACSLFHCLSWALREYHTAQPFCLAANLWEVHSAFLLWKSIKKLCIHWRCRASPTSVLQKGLLSVIGGREAWSVSDKSTLVLSWHSVTFWGFAKRAHFLSCFHVSRELKFNRPRQSLISQCYFLLSQRQKIFRWMEVPK